MHGFDGGGEVAFKVGDNRLWGQTLDDNQCVN